MKTFYPPKLAGKVQLMTACCYKRNALLRNDRYKQFVLEGLSFMVARERVWLYGYVVLEDEFHAMWQQRPQWDTVNARQPLLRHIARQLKYDLRASDGKELERYRSHLADRVFQFWEKEMMRVEIANYATALAMLENMHDSPAKSGLCQDRATYPYSSAWFYANGPQPVGVPVPGLMNFSTAFPEGATGSDRGAPDLEGKRFVRGKSGLFLPQRKRNDGRIPGDGGL